MQERITFNSRNTLKSADAVSIIPLESGRYGIKVWCGGAAGYLCTTTAIATYSSLRSAKIVIRRATKAPIVPDQKVLPSD